MSEQLNFEHELREYIKEGKRVISSLSVEFNKIEFIANQLYSTYKSQNKILLAGNGGSCADAEHFAGELVCTFKDRKRLPLGAISLANNSSALTAWSNDFEFESFFERQVLALGIENDILFLFTTGGGDLKSGASLNLVAAAKKAKQKKLKIITIAGKGGGVLKDLSDCCIVVDSDVTGHIQEAHMTIVHMICIQLDLLMKSYE